MLATQTGGGFPVQTYISSTGSSKVSTTVSTASSQMTLTILLPAVQRQPSITWSSDVTCCVLLYQYFIHHACCKGHQEEGFRSREGISGGEKSYRYVYILIWHAVCWRPAGHLQKKVKKQKPVDEGHLISKPTGQAGRGSGFKLRPSMGLKKPHYNRLMVHIFN